MKLINEYTKEDLSSYINDFDNKELQKYNEEESNFKIGIGTMIVLIICFISFFTIGLIILCY